jgi:hypothetical protein
VASAATRLRRVEAAELVPAELAEWRSLRGALEVRQRGRTLGRRFRHDPENYLRYLESAFIKPALPP